MCPPNNPSSACASGNTLAGWYTDQYQVTPLTGTGREKGAVVRATEMVYDMLRSALVRDVHMQERDKMNTREAELRDAAAMARVSVDSYRAAHRDQIPEASLMQFTYEESERNWARAIHELSEADERQEYIYVSDPTAKRGACDEYVPMLTSPLPQRGRSRSWEVAQGRTLKWLFQFQACDPFTRV